MRLRRPVFTIGENCLKHWSHDMCIGCVYDAPGFEWVSGRLLYRLRQPFRAAFFRLVARIEYLDDWGEKCPPSLVATGRDVCPACGGCGGCGECARCDELTEDARDRLSWSGCETCNGQGWVKPGVPAEQVTP